MPYSAGMTKPQPFKRKPGPRTERLLGELTPATVGLDELTRKKALVLGKGNLSCGLREAVRTAYDRYQRTPDEVTTGTPTSSPAEAPAAALLRPPA